MGCVSSKILTKSGSYQEKVMNNSFQRSNLIEEIILSNSKSNGDQFLALLCTSNSVTRTIKDTDQSSAVAAETETAKNIETINVSELLADLEEEQPADQEQHQEPEEGEKPSAQCCSDGAAGRAKSFRTVEEFDAMVTQNNPSEQEQERPQTPPSDHLVALVIQSNPSEQEEQPMTQEATGAKRRARARELAELKVPAAAFDFSKSGSLRDWLLRGGQIFSPGSYVTPKFGSLVVPSEQINGCQIGEQHAVFDPELVAQFEQAMEQLSMDEEHILKEIVEVLEDDSENKNAKLERSDEPVILH